MRPLNVLSLFDGVSCARMALNLVGIPIGCYMASEIDKYAIKAAMANYPDTIQIGDVCKVSVRKGGVYVGSRRVGPVPDFLCAGSPCQGFSKAGKGLNFSDPRSALFFEFARILNEAKKVNPKVKFFLENVDMVPQWRKIITKHVGVQPIFIDSQVLCAQQRQRWYWQNFIPNEKLYEALYPKNRGLVIQDILEDGPVDEKYFLSDAMIARLKVKGQNEKAGAFTAGGHSGGLHSDMTVIEDRHLRGNYKDKANAVLNGSGRSVRANGATIISQSQVVCETTGKMDAITAKSKGGFDQKIILYSDRGIGHKTRVHTNGKAGPLSSRVGCSHDHQIEVGRSVIQVNESIESGGVQPYQQNRIYDSKGLMPALNAELSGRNNVTTGRRIRRLTPIEVGRLQGIADDYFFKDGKYIISETQVYKCCGNGWQVDTIEYLFKYLAENAERNPEENLHV